MVIGAVVYTEVIVEVKVEGMKCQALLDMGAGSSRTSASLLKEQKFEFGQNLQPMIF